MTGEYKITLDDKGRIMLPARVRSQIADASLVLTQSIWRRAFPQPVRGTEHLLALIRVATEAFLRYFQCIGFSGKLHKVSMVPDSLFVATARAPDGALMELLVAAHTLAVDSTFKPYTVRCYGVEGILMTGRTAHGLRGIGHVWPIMMTSSTII